MRKIFCAKCGHEDHIEDVRYELGRPNQTFDYRDLRALARAIRDGDGVEAACALDRLFRGEPQLREEIEIGRYERRAG